jgi:hypothetical protein
MFVLSWPPEKSKLKHSEIYLMECFFPDANSHLFTILSIKNIVEPSYDGSLFSSKQQLYPRMAFCSASCLINTKYSWNSFCSTELKNDHQEMISLPVFLHSIYIFLYYKQTSPRLMLLLLLPAQYF